MGRDYPAFVTEAVRVLQHKGYVWIAEVRSRFVPDNAKVEDFVPFLAALKAIGLSLVREDLSNKMFVVWILRKDGKQSESPPVWPELRACIYKRR